MKNKTWKKPVVVNRLLGKCRYCKKEVYSENPFVAYANKDLAHANCDNKFFYTLQKRPSPSNPNP